MSSQRAFQVAAALVSCMAWLGLLTPPASGQAEQAAAPQVTRVRLVGKTLIVEGENFAAGAKLLVNGERVKSFNDEATPTTTMVVNKAKRRLPVDVIASLQVRNPDGQTSPSFVFFTGLTLTYENTMPGTQIDVHIGQKFFLDFNFNDDGIQWEVLVPPGAYYPVVEAVQSTGDIIPGSQGIYLVRQLGPAGFDMRGERPGQAPFRHTVVLNTVE